jgi:hypothetical protein
MGGRDGGYSERFGGCNEGGVSRDIIISTMILTKDPRCGVRNTSALMWLGAPEGGYKIPSQAQQTSRINPLTQLESLGPLTSSSLKYDLA